MRAMSSEPKGTRNCIVTSLGDSHKPWSSHHIDFAGPLCGKMLLIIIVLIDAYSKWIDVHVMQTSTRAATVERLRATFSTHGLPKVIVSDNGPNFTSEEFETFLKSNGIRHIKTAPYHLASNGLAERAVLSVKEGIKKQSENKIVTKVHRFLFQYRITPHTTTGRTPAELLMNRKLKSRLDLVRPDVSRTVRSKQEKLKQQHDQHIRERNFDTEDPVYITNYGKGNKWISATIAEKTGPLSYTAVLEDGHRTRKYQDQIFQRNTLPRQPETQPENQPNDDKEITESQSVNTSISPSNDAESTIMENRPADRNSRLPK